MWCAEDNHSYMCHICMSWAKCAPFGGHVSHMYVMGQMFTIWRSCVTYVCHELNVHHVPVMCKLHWLPIRERITYKVLLLTFKILIGEAPTYLAELISLYNPSRTLRSASRKLLCEIPCKTSTYGRSFSVISPKLRNSLPDNVRNSSTTLQFKSRLKTHHFKSAYAI